MLAAASFLPSRFRGEQPSDTPAPPSKANKKITPVLQFFARVACSHPVHTIVTIALIASSAYVGAMRESLLDATRNVRNTRNAEWSSLVEGSRVLSTGPEAGWRWQAFDANDKVPQDADHQALITLVFPDSSENAAQTAPLAHVVPIPNNLSVHHLPSTSNSITTYAQDSALAFAVKYSEAPEFVAAVQEIPNDSPDKQPRRNDLGQDEQKMWIMKVARGNSGNTLVRWVQNAYSEFLDLLKNADTLDIVIMILGYLSMHLTFVSLFLSMKKLGSNTWLAISVLFSSTFAFLFGLNVTTMLGVPISLVLLSEGLPFLVVTIGFEKNIVLTRSVLSHALEYRKPEQDKTTGSTSRVSSTHDGVIQYAVSRAIKDTGFDIVRDYLIEIVILIAGAASGVQGGLQQFCFLAAWILFFDCILLFTFYTAVLSIKLEVNRMRRHLEMRRALEDDGVSRRVAEKVASSNDWPRQDTGDRASEALFGKNAKSNSVPKFKFWMVVGFFGLNLINVVTIPFRTTGLSGVSSWSGGLGGVVSMPPLDPFKVASNGLDEILFNARSHSMPTIVTVLTPIKYELEYPSVHYAVPSTAAEDGLEGDRGFVQLGKYGVGGRVVGGIFESLEDPILSKWIVIALAMSVALNGYLFNVARWGIKDPNAPDHPINRKDLAAAERFNDPRDQAMLGLGVMQAKRKGELPITPAETDDEGAQSRRPPRPVPAPMEPPSSPPSPDLMRSREELDVLLKEKRVHEMSDSEVIELALINKIPGYALEKSLKDCTRAVKIRRSIISRTRATTGTTSLLERSKLPYQNYNWDQVLGACCENVIGYMPLPVGVAGPLVIDGQSYFVPMATTEGVLVASTSRGAKAINAGGGAVTVLTGDGMTRGPCVSFETLERAGAAKLWLDSDEGQATMKRAFNSTSRFARLQSMKTSMAGTYLYIRFKTTTGDAMGMNMISKGVEYALKVMSTEAGFEDMDIVSVSGNFCIDKKPGALNWIDGRGKSVVAEAIIPGEAVRAILKSDVDALVELNIAKNLIGSAMAASVGGFNAHAANIVAAVFLATGQDPAQVVESANCITTMRNLHGSLQIAVSMPSIEVGTLGGGTILEPQSAMLDLLGVRGSHPTNPGDNARKLARIIGGAVLAGELSLCSALAAGHLVQAHMAHNRSQPPTRATTPAPSASAPSQLSMTTAETGKR
ncbi:hydroxymethylglutaryl-coenzyme A reductase [Xylaria sp. CBS 124048]|nr:hydroxymethylglutaryl-coenzyme A reductase [Xylaria sp. CBS 124048]